MTTMRGKSIISILDTAVVGDLEKGDLCLASDGREKV